MKGKTSTGFEFDINENLKKDWRVVKAIAQADSDDASDKLKGYTSLVTLLLGKKGEKDLENHVMTSDGIVPLEAINSEVIDMIRALKEDKEIKK